MTLNTLKTDIFAGLTVAMTMIPESLAFAILAGLSPLTGLYAAFIMGLVTGILGGRPGMVSGGAGSTAVVMMALVASHGTDYLFAAVALAGIFQFTVGALKLGKFIKLIPQPVMYGFLNGLAVIIFMAQLESFKLVEHGVSSWLQGSALYITAGLTLFTIAIVVGFPKITKAIPSSLIAIAITFSIVYFFNIPTKKVVDIAAIDGVFPHFNFPMVPLTWETLKTILPYSVVMAGVGLLESLLTLNMVDEMTHTKGNSNKESVAQGVANLSNGFFGGMGGCGMVAQTLVNIKSGGKTKLSAIIGALTILAIILVGAPVIEQIPMAALVGVMMMVAITTFKWSSFRIITKMPKADIFVGVLVAFITVALNNLALAVLVGVIISALVYAWENSKKISIKKSIDADGCKIYHVQGQLFFGSTTAFGEEFTPEEDPQKIRIDFQDSKIMDMSAIEILKKISDKYANLDKEVSLQHLSPDCVQLLNKANGFIDFKIESPHTS